jgi:aspartate/methionine/tyrosine aminotransferase
MAEHDASAIHNIAETCSASLSINQLQSLGADRSLSPINLDGVQGYGAICGTIALRSNVANLYRESGLSPDNVLITPGAIHANFLVLYALVGPGDHVICHYPTYQQLYSVPESFGATVSLWKAKEDNNWRLDINDLEKLITPKTKMIILK